MVLEGYGILFQDLGVTETGEGWLVGIESASSIMIKKQLQPRPRQLPADLVRPFVTDSRLVWGASSLSVFWCATKTNTRPLPYAETTEALPTAPKNFSRMEQTGRHSLITTYERII